jgi:hypothetical protein
MVATLVAVAMVVAVAVASHHAVKVALRLHLGSAVIAIMRHCVIFAALGMAE